MRDLEMLTAMNRYDFQPQHFRLTHDVCMDTAEAMDAITDDNYALQCNKENDINSRFHSTSSPPVVADKLNVGSMLESRNLRNISKIKSEEDKITAGTERKTKHKAADSVAGSAGCGVRIEDFTAVGSEYAKSGLNSILAKHKIDESKIFFRSSKLSTKIAELRSSAKTEQASSKPCRSEFSAACRPHNQLPQRPTKPAAPAGTLSLAEELSAALGESAAAAGHHGNHLLRATASSISQFLIAVADLGSPENIDPVNKYRDVVCDMAYGTVVHGSGEDEDPTEPTYSTGSSSPVGTADSAVCMTDVDQEMSAADELASQAVSSSSCRVGYASQMSSGDCSTSMEADCSSEAGSSCVGSPVKKSPVTGTCLDYLDERDATHRGCHKFVPRHPGELAIEISDPIYVEVEEDDLWCEGVNLRTKQRGIFPTAYATDLSILEDVPRTRKFFLKFLGSIEVSYHKGNEVLVQAINKLVSSRQRAIHSQPPPLCCLEVNESGIKMAERAKKTTSILTSAESPLAKKLARLLAKDKEKQETIDHFFSLKNVCFCGYHPKNERYFGIITKHPMAMRFACHVFQGEKSAKTVAEVIGEALQRFFQEYLAVMNPTEDIYLE